MLSSVPVQRKEIENYRSIVGDEIIEHLKRSASKLWGARVLHINSTAYGGGVAEILYTLVPLMNSLGLNCTWQVISGDSDFFTITKLMHNGLQGMEVPWNETMWEKYLEMNKINAEEFEGEYDFIVVHDPQPAAMLKFLKESGKTGGAKFIWRCHIDTTSAFEDIWKFMVNYIAEHDAAVFTKEDYIKSDCGVSRLAFIAPSIDPLSPKNMIPNEDTVRYTVNRYGIDLNRRILLQVSRFDPWKDPLGVIDSYRMVKSRFPDIQLVFLASMASDDPEGWHYYELTEKKAHGDPDIFLLSNVQGVGNLEVSAFQAAATIVIQKSLREGFGLTVTEAMWKEKPVVAGAAGGILMQIESGHNGFLVESIESCADRIIELLEDEALRLKMGERGRKNVLEKYLSTRHLQEYIDLFNSFHTYSD